MDKLDRTRKGFFNIAMVFIFKAKIVLFDVYLIILFCRHHARGRQLLGTVERASLSQSTLIDMSKMTALHLINGNLKTNIKAGMMMSEPAEWSKK